MTKANVHSIALDQSIEVGRIIGHLKGPEKGPTLIFIGGMHGNEPSGVFALSRVVKFIEEKKLMRRGSVYALSGNLWALQRGERFDQRDLNRLWTADRMQDVLSPDFAPEHEDARQQKDLCDLIQRILEVEEGPFYFLDLHTTSSETIPFIVVNDSLLNRKFTSQYPLPIILGIEEYLDGPLLSYINEKGYVAFGYEAGQHDDLSSIENHVAFVMLTLVFNGVISKEDIDFTRFFNQLAKHSVDARNFFEIFYRYKIKENESFVMEPGYVNFQNVNKGELLATTNGEPILADRKAKVFMPLYQNQGSEGFFAIRRVPKIFLRLSIVARKSKLDRILALLPGVRWADQTRESLIVDRRVARFFTKQVFHLMGYRSRTRDANHYVMKNRESASRDEEYALEPWND